MHGMRLVQAHLAELMIEGVKDRDLVGPLEQVHSIIDKNEWHLLGPTLVARGRIALPGQRNLAEPLHHFCRPGLQDRIGVIADQLVDTANAGLRASPTHPVPHRTGTRCRRL